MRQTIILAALAAAILALWGGTTIVANPQKAASEGYATTSIGVMQMMKDAKGLPEQQYDAY